MGLLADAFSYGNGLKRKVNGLLADPVGTLELGVNRLGEDQNKLLALMKDVMPAGRYVAPEVRKNALKELADYGSQVGLAGTVGGKFVYPQEKALATAQRNAAKPVSEGGLGLRPDNTAMERAKAMGFEDGWKHGSPNPEITAFDPSPGFRRGADFGPATFATKSGDNASGYSLNWQEYANHPEKAAIEEARQEILSRFLKAREAGDASGAAAIRQELNSLRDGDQLYSDFLNYKVPSSGSTVYPLNVQSAGMPSVNGGGKNFNSVHPEAIPNARNSGASGVLIGDVADNSGRFSGTSDVAAVFEPSRLRSRFAAFDPLRKHEADLLAGMLPFSALVDEDNRNKLRGLLAP